MVGIHTLAELAPRDILSRVLFAEEKKGPVYLDMRHIKNLQKDFPLIVAKLKSLKINPLKEPAPVTAVAHYSCGGVLTDLNGKTNIGRLYAAGEVACTGLHGANRLASNSLLEAAVMGKQVGENPEKPLKTIPAFSLPVIKKQRPAKKLIVKIQNLMWKNIGIIREKKNMKKAIGKLLMIQNKLPPPTDKASAETDFLAKTALLVAQAASQRKQSLGCHFIGR
jgi:L-aspartate oxidase